MLTNRVRLIIGALWFIACVATLGTMGLGIGPTIPGAFALALLAAMLTTVAIRVFRGAPPKSVGQVLYETDHPRQGR